MFQSFLIIGMCNEDQYTTITDMTNPTNGLNKVIELLIIQLSQLHDIAYRYHSITV